jgi:hypothetical protein
MTMTFARRAAVLALLAGVAAPAFAQDSVGRTAGQSDAIDVYNLSVIYDYVVDTVPVTSSWGNAFRVAPILKASNDNDPLFTTQLLGSSALSADQLVNQNFAPRNYLLWTVAGQGLNELRNFAPASSVSRTSFTRVFGAGFSDFASVATNAWGASIGQDASNPDRLFVSRVLAAASRLASNAANTATLSLGGVDASGNLYLRADNFASTTGAVLGENIVRVFLPARGDGVVSLSSLGATNVADEPTSTTYLINASTTTTNVPAAIPASLGGGAAAILDFANNYRASGGAGVTTHLASGIGTHRGNPSFSTAVTPLGGVGTAASLARPTGANPKVNAINLWSVNASGGVVATRGAVLPANITDGQGFTANTNGNAEFKQYLSQTSFRGGSGQVGVGLDPLTNTYVAAATATDTSGTEYIALARFAAGTVTWTVPAFEGKAVLDGPSGTSIGTIASGALPVSISAPAVDFQGNVYFVAAFQPVAGPVTTALIKAVNTASGYRLERILQAGQSFVGANSTRTYTIDKITLGDSDSIASGSFFSGNLLQPTFPGQSPTNAADPKSFGGAIVNVALTYNNNGTPEPYQAVLFVGPQLQAPAPVCIGDADGSGTINFSDITAVLANFGSTGAPGIQGDADNNGSVNFSDVTAVLANFGSNC